MTRSRCGDTLEVTLVAVIHALVNNIMQPKPSASASTEVEVGILKEIHSDLSSQLRFTAERSFTTALQTVTLNLVVLGGLIIKNMALLPQAKWLGSIMLVSFNITIIIYLHAKGRGYYRVKKELLVIRTALMRECHSIQPDAIRTEPSKLAFFTGTGIFMLAVAIACVCAVCGFWVHLTNGQTTIKSGQAVNVSTKRVTSADTARSKSRIQHQAN